MRSTLDCYRAGHSGKTLVCPDCLAELESQANYHSDDSARLALLEGLVGEMVLKFERATGHVGDARSCGGLYEIQSDGSRIELECSICELVARAKAVKEGR